MLYFENDKVDETFWERVKFEIEYFSRIQMSKIRDIKKGIKNLWKYKKIIWKDRWWDYYFFVEIIKFKIKDMESHWGKDTIYIDDYKEENFLKELINILSKIEHLENSESFEASKEISELYEQFGILLFGRDAKGISRIEKLWD